MNKYNLLILLWLLNTVITNAQENIDLSGKWRFSLDQEDKGIAEKWQDKTLGQLINLPGTTDEAGYGEKTAGSDFGILTRAYKYCGPAWYQQTVYIPDSWKDKHVFLELERVMWESKVFIDGKELSTLDALNSAHWHDLGSLSPGMHQLTLRINNDMIHNIGDKGHVYTEYTQSIWNGVVGNIRLVAKNKIHLANPQIFTHINPVRLQVMDTIVNNKKTIQFIKIAYNLYDRQTGELLFTQTERQPLGPGKNPLRFIAEMPLKVKLWDDMNPNLYRLQISLLKNDETIDTREMEIGFREVKNAQSKILVNNRPVYLRGNLDCVHFPLTGYPSCKTEDWEKIFRTYKAYGLNHVRFHSWCPPKAAFIAANRVGIYIQAETIWIDWWMTAPPADRKDMYTKGRPEGLGKNPSADRFIPQEINRMVNAYGNEPSFIMLCIGNELGNSNFDVMESWLKPLKEKDSRRLYAVSSARKITPLDQYAATHYIDKIGGTRGLRGATTNRDYEETYSKATIPVIAHEIGQWPVYPKWEEILKYKGTLKARNFEEFREQARKNHIEEQNEDFVKASGALNQLLYKNEIEAFLRTPSCAGFQLLSMQDYQGQGEALIGWLDVFYDSKGITTPEQFRQHCDTTVCLLRIPKFVWENDEQFSGKIQLAHYGNQDLSDSLYWKIKDEYSNLIGSGYTPLKTYPRGSSDIIGELSAPLVTVTKASKLTVEIGLCNTANKNTWNIWVYPSALKQQPNNIYITDRFDANCQQQLNAGKKVLLLASELGNEQTSDNISFYPLYWSLTFFPGQGINTIGLLVRDKHPLFSGFPTEGHSDWQWQHIYKKAKGFYLNDYPANYKPIAQPVDDFHRNNKLGAVFEMKVGKGDLLVCGFDLKDDKNPVARQLKSSILRYMGSNEFHPEQQVSTAQLAKMFTYVEPLKSEIPKEFSNAILYVECGVNQKELNTSEPWGAAQDKSEAKKQTSYQVACDGTWKDETSSAWHGKEMTMTINCPQGFIGSLYVFFHDWNSNGRDGILNFEGRDYILGKHDKEGKWIKLHVMREDSNNGTLILKTNVKHGPNLMISKVILLEE